MSSYRSYTSWGKGLGSTGTSSYSSGLGSKTDTGSTSQYDYGSRRYGSTTGSSLSSSGLSSSGSSYRAPPVSYRSPYTSGARDRSNSRDKSSTAALIDKYGSKENLIDKYGSKDNLIDKYGSKENVSSGGGSSEKATGSSAGERLSLRDKYTSYGTYPGREAANRTGSGYGAKSAAQKQEEEEEEKKERERERDRDAATGYRSLARRPSVKERDLSPSDLPQDKLYGGSSALSSYSRLYGRGSAYSRSNSRDAGDSGSSSAASTPATTPVQIPTSLRFGSGARYGGMSVRSPAQEKPPSTFGLSASAGDRYASRYSRYASAEDRKSDSTLPSPSTPTAPAAPDLPKGKDEDKPKDGKESSGEDSSTEGEEGEAKAKAEGEAKAKAKVYITVVTRGTSPTPPSTSPYLRSRRADLARVLEKTVAKPETRPEMADKEVQSDRGDDTARHSRYGGTSRASPYLSAYLDRYGGSYSSPVSRYSSYTSRYSSREPSVTNSKTESEPATPDKTDPPKIEPTKSDPPKSETTKPTPPKTLSLRSEVPKPDPPKVTTTSNSSPLPSKDLNKSTNKFADTKIPIDTSTKDTTKSNETAKAAQAESKDESKESKDENKSPQLSKSKSTKTLVKKSPSVSRSDSSSNVTESPATKSPIVSRSGSTKNLSDSSTTKSLPVSRSDSTKSVSESSKPKSPALSRSDSQKTVPDSPATKSPSLSRSDSMKSTPESPATKSPAVSRSDSVKNLSDSSSTKSPAVSKSESTKNVSESPSTKSPIVSRSNSFKGVAGKPPIGKSDSSTSNEAMSLKTKSPSSSSLSEAQVNKTPPLSPSASKTKTDTPLSPSASKTKTDSPLSPSASKTKADAASVADAAKPPPVPKPDGSKTSALHAGKNNLINKDFRKSPLNVGEQEGDQKRKALRSAGGSSLSSSDAETPADAKPPSSAERTAAALRLSKSLSKLAPAAAAAAAAANAKTNFLEVPKPKSGSSSPKRQSPVRSKSRRDARKAPSSGRSTSRSPRQSVSHSSSDGSDSSTDSSTDSSSETSSTEDSSTETSSSESDSESAPRASPRRRPRRSPDTRASGRSSADDLSLTADKPPRPPAVPKAAAAAKQEAQSFLMRALAPVTNLFRRGGDADSASEEISRAASNQSVNKSDKEASEGEPKVRKKPIRRIESGEIPWWIDDNAEVPEGVARLQSNKSIARLAEAAAELKKSTDSVPGLPRTGSNQSLRSSDKEDSGSSKAMLEGIARMQSNKSIAKLAEVAAELQKSDSKNKFRIRKVESGERPWWLDSNSSIPEGVQRILSNSSLAASSDGEKRSTIPKVRSSRSLAKLSQQGVDDEQPKLFRIRHVESGEKAWWLSSCGDIPEGIVRLSTSSSESSDSEAEKDAAKGKTADGQVPKFPLVLRESRRGSGSPREARSRKGSGSGSGRQSPYDNIAQQQMGQPEQPERKAAQKKPQRPKNLPLFIGSHTNIDDILGSAATMVEPAMGVARLRKKLQGEKPSDDDLGDSECEEVFPSQVRVHDSTAQTPEVRRIRSGSGDSSGRRPSDTTGMIKLDDAALQLYKDGDYGSYLDLEASLSEQQEDLEGFQDNRKNSIVLRTQLSVRVHTIIEKLLNSEGRELRRALFSLKQIFQEDKDLVHEFVQNDGLACLIKVGSEADQNYQNYILRALGQVMLYVDGMNGVMEHNQTVQWLYTLIASKYRLVVKTALKLLLVFVEYVETNCLLLIKAIHAVDKLQGTPPWSNIMKLLKDYDAADTELLIYATTLVNKTLNGIPDQDTYYDQADALEEQGMEGAVQRYMSKQGTDLDLLRQLQIYEAVLHHEDGEDRGSPLKQLDENIRKTLRNRKALNESMSTERRKSRRHSTGTSPYSSPAVGGQGARPTAGAGGDAGTGAGSGGRPADDGDETGSSSSRSSPGPGDVHVNGSGPPKEGKDVGVTPALRRRRERAERQRSFIREQQETAATLKASLGNAEDSAEDDNQKMSQRILNGSVEGSNKFQANRTSSRKDMTPLLNAVNSAESESKADSNGILKKPWVLSMMYGKNGDGTENVEAEEIKSLNENGTDESSERKMLLQLKRENTVKDLTQKLSNQNILHSPVEEGSKINRIGDMTGLISKAKEGLAKSKSKADVTKSPTGENLPKQLEVKKSETELHWEELVSSMKRPLSLCDLDFTDLKSEDEIDILSPTHVSNGIPPPPPPVPIAPGMPPRCGAPPPPPPVSRLNSSAPPPPLFGVNLRNNRNGTSTSVSDTNKNTLSPTKKTKKTVKLFWKEVRDDPIILAKLQKAGMIWDELNPVSVDTQKLEHLFESRAKDLITKKQQELNKNKEIIVLDHKRSNAINIGMTKLPPPRSIKTAILKMDATIMNREGIEKLLTMLPTEEERAKIQEAQMANPDLPLGSAEQFLLTLASISELPARLKLWAFKLDYENSEKEIAEPLMDLKQGMETLKTNKTFRGILSTLLSIGIFLNGTEVKGFQIEYLAKVPEVKDTVHKHSLLHHLCHMVMEKFPDSSDLYSEIGAVTRASKVDFDELAANIQKMEQECKASWDHLKVIAKHDGSTMKQKISDFLADCAERIIVLGIVHRRVMNRFHKFLLWLGIPLHRVTDTKPNEFCRIVSEFSLEYRTTRERVLQQLEKKANHRERNKTRGKMITEVGKFRTKEDRADAELRQLLGSDVSDVESIHGTLPWRRQRKDLGRTSLGPLITNETINGNLTDGDDEILESLVKTATKVPTTRTAPRERKRTRHADRKSLRRTLRNGLSEEDKKHLAAYIKGY